MEDKVYVKHCNMTLILAYVYINLYIYIQSIYLQYTFYLNFKEDCFFFAKWDF